MSDDVLDTITPAQWDALATEARRDGATLGAHSTGNHLHIVAADAIGARHWLQLRRDRAIAVKAVRAAHAAGATTATELAQHIGTIATNYAPLDTAARLVGRPYVDAAASDE